MTTAVVTGALGGLGTAITTTLLRQGFDVVGCDRATEQADAWVAECEAVTGRRPHARALDVTAEEQVTELADELSRRRVAVLVNAAGVQGPAVLGELTTKRWDVVVRVNLHGTFFTCRAFVPGMAAAGFGRVVNFGSVYGYEPGHGQAAYAASKAGVIGLTRSVALDHAKAGVTANVICPGLVWHENLHGVWSDEQFSAMAQQVPMGFMGSPNHVSGLVGYLVSDDGGYMTGQVLHVNGGLYLGG